MGTTKQRRTTKAIAGRIEILRGLAMLRDGFAKIAGEATALREELLRCGRFEQANDVERVAVSIEEMGGVRAVDRARQRMAMAFGDDGAGNCTGGTPVPPGREGCTGGTPVQTRRAFETFTDRTPVPPGKLAAGGES